MVILKMHEMKMGLAQCSIITELWAFDQKKISSHSLLKCQNNLASFHGSCTEIALRLIGMEKFLNVVHSNLCHSNSFGF